MGNNATVLLLAKKPGTTSFSSLKPVKRIIDPKAGHAGTLDKFAEGLMIVLTGAFTKLNPLFSELDKRYVATIRFGQQTETLDPEGAVTHEAPIPSLGQIEHALAHQFEGTIRQSPPQYSAIHIDGKRAYRLAREGADIEMPERDVTIFGTRILAWNPPHLVLSVHCSKGTYIRSLARDIALACGSRAHLRNLVRTSIGPYGLDEAVDPEDAPALRVHAESSVGRLGRLSGMGRMVVDAESGRKLGYGNLPHPRGIVLRQLTPGDAHALLFSESDELLAVARLDSSGLPNGIVALPCVGNC